ncbi:MULTISPECIES: hypothetical protein [Bacillus cereus group]|uniref:Uncharacterized protein n=1 Tax=Bacillus cereus TaxID=1396 RepID=A0A2B1DGR3_BACCE|nr:hypothetical protein [Bacillus cereus]PFA13926.1 hypothetical protein CN382_12475 [Bacillus cereus]PFM38156.1 hypothetical protein COJ43_18180 [Bacillus cereus]PGQ07179.1 hypothetical protein COA08_19970 [Bacillus cereus]
MESLTIPEFFFLLSIDDDKGTIQTPYQSNIEILIMINILLELYLQKFIYIDHEFNIRRTDKTSNISYLQQILDATEHLGDKHGIKVWLMMICSKQQLTHKLYNSVLECIQHKKQIKIIEKRVLGISFQKKYNCLQTKDQVFTFLRRRSLEGERQYLSVLTLFLVMDLNGMLKSKIFQSNYEYLMQLEEYNEQLQDVTILRKVIRHVKEALPNLLIRKHVPFSSI